MADVKPFIPNPWHLGTMLPNDHCQDCKYVCQWPEITLKGAAMKKIFNAMNRAKKKLLREKMHGNNITTATDDSINSYLQKFDVTHLYTSTRFDYSYARQLNHRCFTSELKHRFGADPCTLKQDLRDEKNYNFILIDPSKSAIESEKKKEDWGRICPKCSSGKLQVLYDTQGFYWYV